MAAVMDAPVTLPTVEDYERAEEAISAAVDALCTLRWRVWYLAGPDGPDAEENRRGPGDEVPTREQIGLVYSAGTTLLGYVDEAREYASELVELVPDLDLVRLEATGEKF